MKNDKVVKFSFLLSGGEEITRTMELRGKDIVDFVGIRRYMDRYEIHIGPHTVDLPAALMKELVENILLMYPDDEDLAEILEALARDRPWLFEKMIR